MNELAIAYFKFNQEVIYNKQTYKFEHGKGRDYIHTVGGKDYPPAEWIQIAEQWIGQHRLNDLYSQIQEYVKNNCPWVKHKELRQYSADCLLHDSYMHWDDFHYQEDLKL